MQTKLNMIIAAIAVFLFPAIFPAQAGILEGQTVTTHYITIPPLGYPGLDLSYDNIVGAGVELSIYDNANRLVDIDFSDTNIVITNETSDGSFNGSDFTYHRLNFHDTFGTIPNFTNVTINPATNWTDFNWLGLFSFNANAIFLDLSAHNHPVVVGQQIVLDLTAEIPEPTTVSLLLVCIGCLLNGRRFRRMN